MTARMADLLVQSLSLHPLWLIDTSLTLALRMAEISRVLQLDDDVSRNCYSWSI
jgi:hypothetical protein